MLLKVNDFLWIVLKEARNNFLSHAILARSQTIVPLGWFKKLS